VADNSREIILKLIIDDREVSTTLGLTNDQIQKLKDQATGVSTSYQNAFKAITTEAFKFNQVTDESVNSMTQWMATQNLSEDEIVQTMAALQQLSNTIDMNSAEWVRNQAAIININKGYENLIASKQSAVAVQRHMTSGSAGATMAMNQLGFAIGDASMIAVNFRFALMGIGNNLPFVAQGLMQAAKEARALEISLGRHLLNSLKGGGGLILAINGLMLLMQLLPELFGAATKAAMEQKDAVKELAQEYENLGTTSLDTQKNRTKIMMEVLKTERDEYKRTIEQRDRMTGSVTGYKEIITNQDRVDEIDNELKELENKLKAIEIVGTQAHAKIQLILGGRYDLSSVTKTKEAISLLNKEFDDAGDDGYKNRIAARITELKKHQEELEKALTPSKVFDESKKRIELEHEHKRNIAEIKGTSELELINMEKSHLEEMLKLYEQYGKDSTELRYKIQEIQLQINNEALGLTTESIKEQISEVDRAMEELADIISTPISLPDPNAAKNYYDAVKFNDDNYYNYRQDLIDDELKKLRDSGFTEIELELYKNERLKELNDEYFQWKWEQYEKDNEFALQMLDSVWAGFDGFFRTLFDEGVTWSDRLRFIWESMGDAFIQVLSDMLKEYIKSLIMREAISKVEQAASVTAAIATGASIASAYAPAAALASIATFGAAPLAASAGLASTVALAQALSLSGLGGFAEGGKLPKGRSGFVEGWHDEIIAPEKTFVEVFRQELRPQIYGQMSIAGNNNSELIRELKLLNSNMEIYAHSAKNFSDAEIERLSVVADRIKGSNSY
jgi:hypothetical protein